MNGARLGLAGRLLNGFEGVVISIEPLFQVGTT